MALLSRHLSTPLGEMLAVASPQGLCLLEFVGQGGVERELAQVEAARGGPVQPGDSAVLAQTACELAEYFAGQLQRFGVPLDLVGTPFQLSAWQALLADLGILLFFLVYTVAFTWVFDRVFGLPASAQAGP